MTSFLRHVYGNDYQYLLKEELIKIKKGNYWLMVTAFLLNAVVVWSALMNWEFHECWSMFTDWTMWLTFIHTGLMLKCYFKDSSLGWLALAHATF